MISIVIPVYNCEKYLPTCIKSVIEQSYQDYEVILINDGSTDDSGRLCDSYVATDSRLKVVHTANRGPSAARNTGIDKCKGETIFFLDSDDFLEENTFERLILAYEQTNAELVIGNFSKISNSEKTSSGHEKVFECDTLLSKSDILRYTKQYLNAPNKFPLLTQSWGRLFKTSIIKDNGVCFNPSLHTFEDVAFNFDYLKYVEKIFFIEQPLYNLLMHTDYLSATMNMRGNPSLLFGFQEALYKAKEFVGPHWSRLAVLESHGNAYVRYTIIQLIRLCLQIDNKNKKEIYRFIYNILHGAELQNSLQFYTASPGDSKLLPMLMRFRLSRFVMMFCEHRAKQRYK